MSGINRVRLMLDCFGTEPHVCGARMQDLRHYVSLQGPYCGTGLLLDRRHGRGGGAAGPA
ncbi:MAG: hypothetical protein JWM61_2897 [Micrococcaceae bacterium]|nr:hypothetical protein [Micrococcaceae bacterium]